MRLEASQSSDVAGVIRPRSDNPTVTSDIHETASEQEPPAKRIRVEEGAALVGAERTIQPQTVKISNSKTSQNSQMHPSSETTGIGQSSVVTNSPMVSNSSGSSSTESLHPPIVAKESVVPPPAPCPPIANQSVDSSPTMVPLKSTMMAHLRTKYRGELEYMLLEFRKLERQLLGAKGAAQIEESAGSRERREKLHSFILHLEDTIRQIEEGCRLEAGAYDASASTPPPKEGSTLAEKSISRLPTPDALTKRKESEESVQKLEEHILANLLPVKVRLKKQLAAQQGATRNPAGMPAPRRGSYVASSSIGAKGTFAAAAEQRRKQAEAARLAAQQQQEQKLREVSDPTQFGNPLKGGSSLTRNLHGTTLGSKQRTHGHGVGAPTKTTEEPTGNRILYGGMVPESTQHRSGVAAASGVHEMVIENPSLMTPTESVDTTEAPETENHPSPQLQSSTFIEVPTEKKILSHKPPTPKVAVPPPPTVQQPKPTTVRTMKVHEMRKESCDKVLTEDERRKMRKNRRKRKLMRLARRREKERQRLVATQTAHPAHVPVKVAGGGLKKAVLGKNNGRKKGPRAVEYICALCNDPYNSTCDYNPWWALAQQECPKCRKIQIPRIDITAPANQIEYHPALLAHIDDNGGNVGTSASAVSQYLPKPPPPLAPHARLTRPIQHPYREPLPPGSDSDSDLSELSDGSLSDLSVGSHDSEFDLSSLTPAEQAEHETFGHKYKGPVLSEDHASRLLVLMQHSSTCPCKHKSKRHRDACRSVKYLMLHVRDCPGTTSNFDVCPFPWCRKVKHLLYHLVSCTTPEQCKICSPTNLSPSLQALDGLNQFRAQKYRERLITFMKRSAAARRAAVPLAYNSKKTGPQPPYMTTKGIPKANPPVYPKHPPRSVPPSTTTRKGKKSGTPPTVAAPPMTYCKPTSATPTARHPWTAMQNSDPKPPTKPTREPMPQRVQSPKGTHPHVVGKTHPTGAINGVVDKVPAPPTYTSVEDPLRASAAHRVQNPVKASVSSGPKAHALPTPAVPLPAAASHQKAHKTTMGLSSVNATSNPIASSVTQKMPSKPPSSHPATFPTGTTGDRVFGATVSQVGQKATMPSKVLLVNAKNQSPHAPVTRHLQPNSAAAIATKPVPAAPRDATAETPGLLQVGVTKAPVQPTFSSHQAVAQASPSVGAAPVKPPAAMHKPTDGASASVAGNSEMQRAPISSPQSPHVHGTREKVEPAIAPALELEKEAPSQASTSHPGHSARSDVATANLASLSNHHVAKVSAVASTTQHVTCEPAAVLTKTEPTMVQASPAHVSGTLHLGAPAPSEQLTKQPASGQVQAQTKLAAHTTAAANSTTAVEKSVLDSTRTPSHVTFAASETATVQPTVGSLQAPANLLVKSTPIAAPAPIVPILGMHSAKYPGALAPSSPVTGEQDIGKVQTQPASAQPNTSAPGTHANANAPLDLYAKAPTATINSAELPIGAPAEAPTEPAQNNGTVPVTIPPATGTKLRESPTNLNDVLHPTNQPSSVHVAKSPVAGLVQSQEGPATKPVEPLTAAPGSGALVPHVATKVSTPSLVGAQPKPAPTLYTTTVPPTSIPDTGVAAVVPRKSVQGSLHPVGATSSKTATVQVGKAISKSSSASKIVQTKLDAGRSVSPSTAERPVEPRKVQQSADIVKVGG